MYQNVERIGDGQMMETSALNKRLFLTARCLSALCLLWVACPLLGQEGDASGQGTNSEKVGNAGEDNRSKWKLHVVHPSLNQDKLYYCTLRMPKSLPIEEGSIVLLLFDRQNRKMGEMGLSSITTHRNEHRPILLSGDPN